MRTKFTYDNYRMACSVAERMHFDSVRCKLYREAGSSVWTVEFN